MSAPIVFVTGSPSSSSRSSLVAEAVARTVRARGFTARFFSIRDFDAADVLLAHAEAPTVAAFLDAVKGAAAVVLSTPVYKATYAGGLKALVDLVPPDALVGKPALGIATTRLPEHGASATRAFSSLFSFFRARTLDGVVVLDSEFEGAGTSTALGPAAGERVDGAAGALVAASRPD